jgi:hypothetical protein
MGIKTPEIDPAAYLSAVQPKPSSTVKKILGDPDFATPPPWAANQRLPITPKVSLTRGSRYKILQEFQQKWQKVARVCPGLLRLD